MKLFRSTFKCSPSRKTKLTIALFGASILASCGSQTASLSGTGVTNGGTELVILEIAFRLTTHFQEISRTASSFLIQGRVWQQEIGCSVLLDRSRTASDIRSEFCPGCELQTGWMSSELRLNYVLGPDPTQDGDEKNWEFDYVLIDRFVSLSQDEQNLFGRRIEYQVLCSAEYMNFESRSENMTFFSGLRLVPLPEASQPGGASPNGSFGVDGGMVNMIPPRP